MLANDTQLTRTHRPRTGPAASQPIMNAPRVTFQVRRVGPPPLGARVPPGHLALTVEYLSRRGPGRLALYIVRHGWYEPFADAVAAAIATRQPYWVRGDGVPHPPCMVGVDDAVAVRLLHAIRDGQVAALAPSPGRG